MVDGRWSMARLREDTIDNRLSTIDCYNANRSKLAIHFVIPPGGGSNSSKRSCVSIHSVKPSMM
jgi:hypothetical protein